MSNAAVILCLYAQQFLAYAVPSVLLLACVIRLKARRHWTLVLLTAALVLLLAGIGIQWVESLHFLAYWLGAFAQVAAAVGGVGIIVSGAKPQGIARPGAQPVQPFPPDNRSGSARSTS